MQKDNRPVNAFGLRPVDFLTVFVFLISLLFTSSVSFAEPKTKVLVGAYDNPPKIRISPSGKVSGFWHELISIIAAEENWEIDYVKGGWAAGLKKLERSEIDIMPDVAFTPQRSQLYMFNKNPVLASWSRVYVREDDNRIKSLEDLQGMRIAGLYASVNLDGPDGIKRLVQSFNLNSTIVEMDNYQDVFQALKDGFADAVITNRNYGDEYSRHNPVKKTPIMLQPVSLLFAFPKDSEKSDYLSRRIDFHLSKLINDSNSVYYTLLTKYFETEIAEKKVKEMPPWVAPLLITVSVAAVFLFSLNILARKQVAAKTKELQELNDSLKKKIAKETEKRLRKEKIIFEQKKFADMGQMIGAISHQWRQPLNNIYLICQYLEDKWRAGEKFSDDHLATFGQMAELINHMSATIDDFRNFFSPDNGKESFDINKTILTCLRLISSELIYHKINVTYKCRCKDKECEVTNFLKTADCDKIALSTYGYAGEFKQIILNILSNSKDAIIETNPEYKKISVILESKDDKALISIEDTGGGIDEKILPQVLDPYFTTKPEGSGIGLGLFMSKTILQNHMKGDLKLENIPGGTRAVITIEVTNS